MINLLADWQINTCPSVLIGLDDVGERAINACFEGIPGDLKEGLAQQCLSGLSHQGDKWEHWDRDKGWSLIEDGGFAEHIINNLLSHSPMRSLPQETSHVSIQKGSLDVFFVGSATALPSVGNVISDIKSNLEDSILVEQIRWFFLIQIPAESLKADKWPVVANEFGSLLRGGVGLDHCFVFSRWDLQGRPLSSEEEVTKAMGLVLAQFAFADKSEDGGFLTRFVNNYDSLTSKGISALGVFRTIRKDRETIEISENLIAQRLCQQLQTPFPGRGIDLSTRLKNLFRSVNAYRFIPPTFGYSRSDIGGFTVDDLAGWAKRRLRLIDNEMGTWLRNLRRNQDASIEAEQYMSVVRKSVLQDLSQRGGFGSISSEVGTLKTRLEDLQKQLISKRELGIEQIDTNDKLDSEKIETARNKANELELHAGNTRNAAFWGLIITLPILAALLASSENQMILAPLRIVTILLIGGPLFAVIVASLGRLEVWRARTIMYVTTRNRHRRSRRSAEMVVKQELVETLCQRLGELGEEASTLSASLTNVAEEYEWEIQRIEDRTLDGSYGYVEQSEETVEIHGLEETPQLPSDRTLYRKFLDGSGLQYMDALVPDQPLANLEQDLKEAIRNFARRTVAEDLKPEGHINSASLTADNPRIISEWIDRSSPLLPPEVVRGSHHGREDAIFGPPDELGVLRNMIPDNEHIDLISSPLSNQLTVVTALSLNQAGLGRNQSQRREDRN